MKRDDSRPWSDGAAGPSLKFAGDPDWRSRSACLTEDPELFFGGSPADIGAAKAACARCPVRDACLDLALDLDLRDGVFGGLSEAERLPLHEARAARLLASGRKRCGACGEVKQVTEFAGHSTSADGYQARCDACRNAARPAMCANGRHPRSAANTRRRKGPHGLSCLDCEREWGALRRQRQKAVA